MKKSILKDILFVTTAVSSGTVVFVDGDPMIQFLREYHAKYPEHSYPQAGAAYMMFASNEQIARETIAWVNANG